jgi:uncharacterized protein YjbI with pentapeptide repeats
MQEVTPVCKSTLYTLILRHRQFLTDFRNSKFQQKKLNSFGRFDCSSLDLSNRSMICEDLSWAICTNAKFNKADLCATSFFQADLRGSDFRDADLCNVIFASADLREAKFDHNLFHVMDISRAKFSIDALPWLMLRPNWLVEKMQIKLFNSNT